MMHTNLLLLVVLLARRSWHTYVRFCRRVGGRAVEIIAGESLALGGMDGKKEVKGGLHCIALGAWFENGRMDGYTLFF